MRTPAVLALVATLLLVPTAEAQSPVDDPRLAAYLAFGFGGDADYTTGVAFLDGSVGLDPTVGFGFRAELPLHEYFVLGGSFEFLSFEADGAFSEREEVFDFNAVFRGRYPIELDRDLWVEPYLALPVGFAMAVLPDGDGDRVWPGWNIGVLAGAYLVLGELPLGFFFELGWRHHQVYTDEGSADLKIVTNQFAMQLGAALRLE